MTPFALINQGRLTLLVCPHLRAEVGRVLAGRDDDVALIAPFSGCCSDGMQPVAPLQAAVAETLRERPDTRLLCGACVRWNADDEGRRVRHAIEAAGGCLELVAPRALIDQLTTSGAHLVSPGWLRHWRAHIEAWGFDDAGLRAFFAESTRRIVLLETGVYTEAGRDLSDFAAAVGLPGETVAVGLDLLSARVALLIAEFVNARLLNGTAVAEHTPDAPDGLSGMLPICAHCKSIRDEEGDWHAVATYLARRANVTFTHGICPMCALNHYGEDLVGDDPR